MRRIAIVFAFTTFAALQWPSAASAQVNISIDTSLADRALELVCSGAAVDEAAVRASPVVQAQIAHNSRLRESATMDAYIAALRAASACAAPASDPFNMSDVIRRRDVFRRQVDILKARSGELSAAVEAQLTPYLRTGETYSGELVLAVPYYSCGGFSSGGRFFIDVSCLDENLESDITGLVLLAAHETFHVIQARYFFDGIDSLEDARNKHDGLSYLFEHLLLEGSASYVAATSTLPANGGRYTRLSRRFHLSNVERMERNFALLNALFEHVLSRRGAAWREAADTAERSAFNGDYQEFGYYVGVRMFTDIEAAWGREALTCVMRLPSEQLALAHDAVATQIGAELRLSAEVIRAAQAIGRRRGHQLSFETCRSQST